MSTPLTQYDLRNAHREVKITYDYDTVVDWLYSSSVELHDVSTGDCLTCDEELDWEELLRANINYPKQEILDKYALTYIEGNILAHYILDGLENGEFSPHFNSGEFYDDLGDFVEQTTRNFYFQKEVYEARVDYLARKNDWDEETARVMLELNKPLSTIIGEEYVYVR